MHTIIGYDDKEEYRDEYHGLLAHGLGGFYALDLKALISAKQDELGVECEFIPLEALDNQGIKVPDEVKAEAYEIEDGYFIGVVRTREEQAILYWVTGREFGKYPDGRIQILPSGSYSPNGTSVIRESIESALAAALKA
jgi:hypothetical protein